MLKFRLQVALFISFYRNPPAYSDPSPPRPHPRLLGAPRLLGTQTVEVFFVTRVGLMIRTKAYSNVEFRNFVNSSFVLKSRTVKVPGGIENLLDFKQMEYISFKQMLKVLKSPIDRDSTSFCVNVYIPRDLKFNESWMYMLVPPPQPHL